jgi:hypothetical protein
MKVYGFHEPKELQAAKHTVVNMLYLDQPVQVGLSYDSLTNITSNLDTGAVKVANFTNGVPTQNNSVRCLPY